MKLKKSIIFKKSTILIALLVGLGCGSIAYYLQRQSGIHPYRVERDLPFVVNILKDNWYWLVAEGSSFDPEYSFTHLTPSNEPYARDKVSARIFWKSNTPAGFIAYYMRNFYEGFIWFLVVQEKYRGQGISKKLVEYALKDLQSRGAQRVWLITRLCNDKARNLYEKLGFKAFWQNEEFIKFEKVFT